jgi:hypothetical protein
MNRKLVFQLSLFGLALGVATVFAIPPLVVLGLWLAVFFICAVTIARKGVPRPFGHGLIVSILSSLWFNGVHVIFFNAYAARHAQEVASMVEQSTASPRLMILAMGPIMGMGSGLVLGLLCLIASKMIGPATA